MPYSQQYHETYQNLPEELPKIYPDLNFDNHCYLRIALDNTFKAKWDTKIKRPAYKNLNKPQLEQVLLLLNRYKTDSGLLLRHNKNSLRWRGK
ncbi:MAG: acetyltransferase [Bacteroidota bacterium]